VELLGRSVGSGAGGESSSPPAARRRPLESVLWRAHGSARTISAVAGSSSAKREARRAQTMPGSNGQGGSPRTANGRRWLGQRSNAREEKTGRLFIHAGEMERPFAHSSFCAIGSSRREAILPFALSVLLPIYRAIAPLF
jgi:hypothetical protein